MAKRTLRYSRKGKKAGARRIKANRPNWRRKKKGKGLIEIK
jgi:hypothetical protein